MYRTTYIEINTENLKHNVQTLMHDYPNYYYYIGVVKGNAYGHGIPAIQALIDAGINYLAVSTLEEALAIRQANILTPILLLQPIHIDDIKTASENNITVTLSDYEYFKKLVSVTFAHEIKVHLKINSGFNRLGISNKEQVKEIFDTLKQNPIFKLEGIYTHFATSGRHGTHFGDQLRAFRDITSLIDLKQIPIVHIDRSLTLFSHPKIDFCTGARIGIGLYGFNSKPAEQHGFKAWIRGMMKPKINLFPFPSLQSALSVYSEIIELQHVKKGGFVGYAASFQAKNDCVVAVVSLGYADGFFRSNKSGHVAIHGKRYQIIAVDMGMISVLVDDTVHVGDKVELIGETISAKEVAVRNNTTVYEILCSFKQTVPRVLIKK